MRERAVRMEEDLGARLLLILKLLQHHLANQVDGRLAWKSAMCEHSHGAGDGLVKRNRAEDCWSAYRSEGSSRHSVMTLGGATSSIAAAPRANTSFGLQSGAVVNELVAAKAIASISQRRARSVGLVCPRR